MVDFAEIPSGYRFKLNQLTEICLVTIFNSMFLTKPRLVKVNGIRTFMTEEFAHDAKFRNRRFQFHSWSQYIDKEFVIQILNEGKRLSFLYVLVLLIVRYVFCSATLSFFK